MSNQPEWIVGHDGNWTMNAARIEPADERYILNVAERRGVRLDDGVVENRSARRLAASGILPCSPLAFFILMCG